MTIKHIIICDQCGKELKDCILSLSNGLDFCDKHCMMKRYDTYNDKDHLITRLRSVLTEPCISDQGTFVKELKDLRAALATEGWYVWADALRNKIQQIEGVL